MERRLTANYHTHTKYCRHASGEIADYIETAIGQGYSVLGFSDHSPYLFRDGYRSFFRMYPEQQEEYVTEVLRCREKYKGQIEIPLGYEMEYYPRHFEETLKLIRRFPCDYLVLGQHFLGNEYDGDYSGDRGGEVKLMQYVDQIREGLDTGVYSCLAHPELINFDGPREIYEEHMSRLILKAIETETPLEINLRGQKYGNRYPDERFIALAARMGAKFIIGVDAHESSDLQHGREYGEAFAYAEKYSLDLLDRLPLKKVSN